MDVAEIPNQGSTKSASTLRALPAEVVARALSFCDVFPTVLSVRASCLWLARIVVDGELAESHADDVARACCRVQQPGGVKHQWDPRVRVLERLTADSIGMDEVRYARWLQVTGTAPYFLRAVVGLSAIALVDATSRSWLRQVDSVACETGRRCVKQEHHRSDTTERGGAIRVYDPQTDFAPLLRAQQQQQQQQHQQQLVGQVQPSVSVGSVALFWNALFARYVVVSALPPAECLMALLSLADDAVASCTGSRSDSQDEFQPLPFAPLLVVCAPVTGENGAPVRAAAALHRGGSLCEAVATTGTAAQACWKALCAAHPEVTLPRVPAFSDETVTVALDGPQQLVITGPFDGVIGIPNGVNCLTIASMPQLRWWKVPSVVEFRFLRSLRLVDLPALTTVSTSLMPQPVLEEVVFERLHSLTSIPDDFLCRAASLRSVALVSLPRLTAIGRRFCAACPMLATVVFDALPLLDRLADDCLSECRSLHHVRLDPASVGRLAMLGSRFASGVTHTSHAPHDARIPAALRVSPCRSLVVFELRGLSLLRVVPAFCCRRSPTLRSVVIADLPSLECLQESAFAHCLLLQSVVLADLPKLRVIEQNFLDDGKILSDLVIQRVPELSQIGDYFLTSNAALLSFSFDAFPKLRSIGHFCFDFASTLRLLTLRGLQLLETIGPCFASNCAFLEECVFEDLPALRNIGASCLTRDVSLKRVVLRSLPGLRSIGARFLAGSSVPSVELHGVPCLTTLGSRDGCAPITTVTCIDVAPGVRSWLSSVS